MGVDVKNAGKDIEVNSISTIFNRDGGITNKETEIYRSEKITPEQEALLGKPNSSRYQPEQELSDHKNNKNSDTNGNSDKNISSAEAQVDTNPTEQQKNAGNYKMGHISIDGYKSTNKSKAKATQSAQEFDDNVGSPDIIGRFKEDKILTVRKAIGELKLQGVKINVVDSISQIPSASVRKAINDGNIIEGWYSVDNNEVYVIAPFISNKQRAKQVIFHELVAHKNLRELLGGKNHNRLMEATWRTMSDQEKRKYMAYVVNQGTKELTEDEYLDAMGQTNSKGEHLWKEAADEYLANMAESASLPNAQTGTWEKIKEFFKDLLRKIGFDQPVSDEEIQAMFRKKKLSNEDFQALLDRSYRDVQTRKQSNENQSQTGNVRFSIKQVNDQFNKELQQQIDGTLPKDHIYKIGLPSDILCSTGFPCQPIEMSASHLMDKRLQSNHPFDIAELQNLPQALQKPIAVFEYGDKKKAQNAIVELTHNGKNFLVGVHFNQKRNGLEVSSVRGLFPKDNAEWLNWISQDKALYLDKEKIQTLINQQQINLADVAYLDLDNVAKVTQNFENPSIQTPKNTTINDILFSINVKHNSPYLLKKADGSFVDPISGERFGFDHRFMGKGEGVQAHGWGSYFSVNDIRRYGEDRKKRGEQDLYIKYKGVWYNTSGNQNQELRTAYDLIQQEGTVAKALKKAEYYLSEAERMGAKEGYELWKKVVDFINNQGVKKSDFKAEWKDVQYDKHHYDVEIPDNNGTNYIEEDEPLTDKQIEMLKKQGDKERELGISGFIAYAEYNRDTYTFKRFSSDLNTKLSQRGISEFLNRAGFTGIHYNGGQDGECYVIFDENDAKIIDHSLFSIAPAAREHRLLNDEEKTIARQALENTTPITAEVGTIKAINAITARKAAERWVNKNLQEPLLYRTEAGTVVFDKTSVKNTLAHGYNQAKLDAIPTIRNGFKNATYLGSQQDFSRPNTTNHYFAYPIKYNGNLNYVFCRAMQDNMTNRLYVHEVFIADKIKSNTLQTEDSALSVNQNGGIALYKDILSDVLNAKIQQNSEPASENEENVRFSVRRFGGNSGYVGYSKSKRAVGAEQRGLRNKSQMDSDFADEVNALIQESNHNAPKVTLKQIRDSLKNIHADEWHHTSMYGNRTNYYSAETIADYFTPETDEERNAREQRETKKHEYYSLLGKIADEVYDAIPHEKIDGKYFFRTSEGHLVEHTRNTTEFSKRIRLIPNGTDTLVDDIDEWTYEHRDEYNKAMAEYNAAKQAAFDKVPQEKKDRVVELRHGLNDNVRFSVINKENGLRALESIANGEEFVKNAMQRDDLIKYGGDNKISFYYGYTGDPKRDFKGGYGIAHIGAKHGTEAILRAIDIIANGKIERYVKGNKTIVLTDGEYETVLSLTRFGKNETWLFNGWEKKENADENSEVSTASVSTQTNPTFSREDLGAAISTYKGSKKYDTTNTSDENNLFSVANSNQEVFISNALRAVEGIRQDKATPEQWLKMIEKAGGLKAGEDKWLGLSDWLKSQNTAAVEPPKNGETAMDYIGRVADSKKTITKQQLLDFIGENRIQIEEVEYSGISEYELEERREQREREWITEFPNLMSDIDYNTREQFGVDDLPLLLWDSYAVDDADERELAERAAQYYQRDLSEIFTDDENEDDNIEEINSAFLSDMDNAFEENVEKAKQDFIISDEKLGIKPINSTRLEYTTKGLDNKREIALTVPTIESWNKGDDIHFGDAGNGRAVAWIRFGETTDEQGNKVLVIDEIQSKRHQEGREIGYARKDDLTALQTDGGVWNIMRNGELIAPVAKWNANSPDEAIDYYVKNHLIPDAPFDKNWHELAMKRMLRLAAEEGYDKVAWTTGEQQAKRYNLGNIVDKIEVGDWLKGEDTIEDYDFDTRVIGIKPFGKPTMIYRFDRQGNLIEVDEGEPKTLAELVGKDMADKIVNADDGVVLEGDNLRIGGEGMKGFYDKMIPSFMNKYGKKWGVQVREVTMPALEDGYQTMHAIDVTPEMKESVMQGQVMFSIANKENAEMESIKSKALANGTFMKAPNGNPTNLNERQWLQVRTKAFKQWFGDWEKQARIEKLRKSKPIVATGEEYKGKYELNNQSAELYIRENLRREYTNKDTKERIRITRTGAEKVTRHDVENEIHLKSIALIPQMLENAIFITEETNEKNKKGFDSYKYYVVGLKINGEDYTAKLVIGEKNGQTYYDHSLTEISKEKLLEESDTVNSRVYPKEHSFDINNVKDKRLLSILENNSSKILDKNGEPMVVYHGTQSSFNTFSRGSRQKNYGSRLSNGFYFSTKKSTAEYYSKHPQDGKQGEVKSVYLNIEKPLYVSGVLDYRNKLNKLSIDYVGSNNYLRDKFSLLDDSEKLQQLGYDGVIELMDDGIEGEIVAINPNQIKSATENNGDFSAGNDDIRFSVSNRTAEASDELSRLLAEIDALDDEINGGLDRTQGRTEDILANEDVWQARIKSKRLQKKLGNLLDQLIQTGRADDKLVRNYLGYLSGGGFYRTATDKEDAIMRIQNAIVRAGGKVTDSRIGKS